MSIQPGSPASDISIRDVRDELIEMLRGAMGAFPRIAHKVLDTFPDALIRRLHATTENSDEATRRYIAWMFGAQKSQEVVETTLDFLGLLTVGEHPVESMIFALMSYSNSPNFPNRHDKANHAKIAEFLINAESITSTAIYNWELPLEPQTLDNGNIEMLSINVGGRSCWALGDERMVHLLIEHPEYTPRIERIAIERDTIDFDVVHSVLTHTAPAVAEGVL